MKCTRDILIEQREQQVFNDIKKDIINNHKFLYNEQIKYISNRTGIS